MLTLLTAAERMKRTVGQIQFTKSAFVRSTGIYTISNVINLAIPFFLLPILTRYLTPFDYGVVTTFGVLLGLAASVIGLNTIGAIARQYYEQNTIDLSKYIANCLLILLVSLAIVAAIMWLFSDQISKLAMFPEDWLWAVFVILTGQFLSQIALTLWQVQVKPLPYGVFQVLRTFLNAVLSILLVVGFSMNWQGRIWAQVVGASTFGMVGLIILLKDGWIKFEVDFGYIMHALGFGVPLIPYALGGWMLTAIDRIFINNLVSVAATGRYAVGYQIGAVISLLAVSFNSAWVPWFYEKLKKNNSSINLKIVKITYIYSAGLILMALVLSLITPQFLDFFVGAEFVGSSQYVIWIAMAYAVKGMQMMMLGYLYYAQKTYLVALTTFLAAFIHVIGSYCFISANGAIGAAQATTITFSFSLLVTWYLAARIHKMPWRLRR